MAADEDKPKATKADGERRSGQDRRQRPPVTIDLQAEKAGGDKPAAGAAGGEAPKAAAAKPAEAAPSSASTTPPPPPKEEAPRGRTPPPPPTQRGAGAASGGGRGRRRRGAGAGDRAAGDRIPAGAGTDGGHRGKAAGAIGGRLGRRARSAPDGYRGDDRRPAVAPLRCRRTRRQGVCRWNRASSRWRRRATWTR